MNWGCDKVKGRKDIITQSREGVSCHVLTLVYFYRL